MIEGKTIYEHLKRVGVPMNLKGYRCLTQAIGIVGNAEDRYDLTMMHDVYPKVAETLGISAVAAERSMRHAIEATFNRTDPDVLSEYFGNSTSIHKGKPTNREFIYGLIEYIERMV